MKEEERVTLVVAMVTAESPYAYIWLCKVSALFL